MLQEKENSNIHNQFSDLIVTARTIRAWGNEHHLYALSIAFQRPIYIYSTFQIRDKFFDEKCSSQQLQQVFCSKPIAIGRHLKYIPHPCVKENLYITHFVDFSNILITHPACPLILALFGPNHNVPFCRINSTMPQFRKLYIAMIT